MNKDFARTLLEPELILPVQITRGARVDGDTSGARALMLAILEDATLCIERGRRRRHGRTRRLAAEAETWVRSDCRQWLFSFASICDVLGIDADALRDRLLTPVEGPASGSCAARSEAHEQVARSGAWVRRLPQPAGARFQPPHPVLGRVEHGSSRHDRVQNERHEGRPEKEEGNHQ
jgi:hypothetical protein